MANDKGQSVGKRLVAEFVSENIDHSALNHDNLAESNFSSLKTGANNETNQLADNLAAANNIWQKLSPRLRSILGNGDFKAWIAPLTLYKATESIICFNAPNDFARSRIRTEYLHRLQAVWNDFDPMRRRLVIDHHATKEAISLSYDEVVNITKEVKHEAVETINSTQLFEPIDLNHCPKTFDNYEKGASNQIAIAVAKRIACEMGGGEIIYFHGLNGVGKTHLLSAIAHHSMESNSKRRVISITAQRFLNLFQNALRDKQLNPFKEGLRGADLLLVDDIQMICGKSATQDEFFQTIMDLLNMGKTVVCTADVPPDALLGLTSRMQGILMGGFNVRIEEPDFELRRKIALRKAQEFAIKRPDFKPPQEAFDILAARIIGTGRSIEGVVKQIFASSALIGQEATMEVVFDTIGDRFKAPSKTVPVENIKKKVAQHFDITIEDLVGTRRHISVARPRQIAMYFCKKFTKRSFPDIAARMGGRDHTTVMHAVKRIEELANKDTKFANELQIIANKILG